MNNRQVATRMVACEQIGGSAKEAFIEIMALWRHDLSVAITEERKLFREIFQVEIGIAPRAHRDTQTRIVSPLGMKMRLCLHDALALRHRRWERHFCRDKVGIRQVFEQ
jgi:hypothetical protein